MNLNSLKKKQLFSILILIGGLFLWIFISKGLKAQDFLSPFMDKIAGTKSINDLGKNILGATKEFVSSENTQKVLDAGTKALDNSPTNELVKTIQETVNQKINEAVETIKNLPEQEVKRIKKEVCKQWMEEEK